MLELGAPGFHLSSILNLLSFSFSSGKQWRGESDGANDTKFWPSSCKNWE